MPEEQENSDEIDEILDPEKTKEEERVERTRASQDELPEYDIKDSQAYDELYSEIEGLKEVTEEVREQVQTSSGNSKETDDRIAKEREHRQIAQKHEFKQHIDNEKHRHHAAYAVSLGGGIALLSYDINPYFGWAVFFPMLAYIKTGLGVKKQENNNWYYKLVTNHIVHYIGGIMGVVTIKAAAGQAAPIPTGVRQEFARQGMEILLTLFA